MKNPPKQQKEARVCPSCERIQEHLIVEHQEEQKKFLVSWVEEVCVVCGAKRVITNPRRKYIG